MVFLEFRSYLYFWIEKFKLISQLIKAAGHKYLIAILSLRILITLSDFLSIGVSLNYFFASETKISLLKNISFFQVLFLLFSLLLIKAIAKGYAEVMREKIRLELTDNLRTDFLRKVLISSNSAIKNTSKSELLGLMFGNISRSVSSLDAFLRLISSIISLLIYILGLISIDKNILAPIFLSILASLIAALVKRSRGWELGNIERKSNNILLSIVGDGFNGLKSIKSSRAQQWLLNKFNFESSKYRKVYQERTIRKAYFEGFKDLFLLIIIGLWLFKYTDLNDNALIISTLLFAFKTSQYSGAIISSIRLCINSLPSYKNLKNISKKLEKELYGYEYNKSFNIFEEVDFFKWETKQNLKVKKLSLKKNQIVVIKGKSGVGKTTLLDNIVGLENPNKSYWEINNNNSLQKNSGKKIKKDICDFVAYCPQENVLFEGSLKENLLFSNAYKDDKEFISLIKYFFEELDLSYIISRFNNLNKNINLSSKPFSGGELQRLCIIRTLLRNKSIEIYDEPTHYLDKATAKKVIDFIIKRSKNKILIIATHEEYIIKKADSVVDLDQ